MTTKVVKRKTATKSRKTKDVGQWNPKLVVFACNWCSYAGADTAGVARLEHDPNFRMIRVMCSGRIQPGFVLKAFEKGADGVLVSGCHFGDCHYILATSAPSSSSTKQWTSSRYSVLRRDVCAWNGSAPPRAFASPK